MRRLEVMPAAEPDFVCVWPLVIFADQCVPVSSRGAGHAVNGFAPVQKTDTRCL